MNDELEHRKSFNDSIKIVEKDIKEMSRMGENAIIKAVKSIEDFDEEAIQEVYAAEKETNELNLDVEKTCLKINALYQPVAKDLRFVASMMKISSIFERICDLAAKIAKIAEKNKGKDPIKPLVRSNEMIEKMTKMMDMVREAIETKEVDDLRKLSEIDDEVDELFSEISEELTELMVENPDLIDEGKDLLYMARYLERSADLVCKVGSRLIYQVKGERVRLK